MDFIIGITAMLDHYLERAALAGERMLESRWTGTIICVIVALALGLIIGHELTNL